MSQARFEPLWHASQAPAEREAELLALAAPGLADLASAFQQARPGIELYQRLRQLYAEQRQLPLPQWQPLASGPLLRPDMQDARVPALAQRLFSEGYLSSPLATDDNAYGPELVNAVKSFQLNHSLQADGVVGQGTLNELNISPAVRRGQLRVNLERFRWLAQDLEPTSLLVNVAAAQLSVYQDGVPVWQTRTQVGRAERQTPLLKSRVTRLTLNPTWTVPPTILREDKLPQIRRDQTFLSRQNLQVLDSEGHPWPRTRSTGTTRAISSCARTPGRATRWGKWRCAFPTRFRCTCTTPRARHCSAKGRGPSARAVCGSSRSCSCVIGC